MTAWDSVKAAWRWAQTKDVTASFDTMNHDMVRRVFGGGPTSSGKTINQESALRVSAAWACQRIITEATGSLPWGIYSRDVRGNAKLVADHPLNILFAHTPNVDQDPVSFKEDIALGLVQHGNAYHMIDRLGSEITSLTPLYCEVKTLRKKGTNTRLNIRENELFYRVHENHNAAGPFVDYKRDAIWHVKGFGRGIVGLSPVAAAREALGTSLASEEFGARFFSQGGMPSGTLTIPNWLNPEQREIARGNLQQLLGGLGNAHKFALFEGGMKPEAWGTMPLDDMQFIEVRKFSVNEICRFYRIPPHMVMDLDRATFSNIEHLGQEFVMYTLMPYLTRIEASVSKWLLKAEERGKVFLRFNVEGLLRADSAGRSAFYSQAVQNGWMNRNEVRAKENLNRVDGLDEFTAQTNLAPVSDLGQLAQAASRKPNQITQSDGNTKSMGDVSVDVVLPQSMRYELEANNVASVLADFSMVVKSLVDGIEAGQRNLAVEVVKGNRNIVRQLEDGQRDIAKTVSTGQVAVLHSITSANQHVLEGHKELSRALTQKRRIRVGDEEFVSEPIEPAA